MQILDLVFLRSARYPEPKCKNGCAGYNEHHAKKKSRILHLHFKCKIKMSEYNNTTHESEDIQTFRIWNLNQLSLSIFWTQNTFWRRKAEHEPKRKLFNTSDT